MISEEDYEEFHEARESLREPPTIICPIGNLPDCKYLHIDPPMPSRFGSICADPDDDGDFWCEHPALGKNGEYDDGFMCPLKDYMCHFCHKKVEEDDAVWINPDTMRADMGKGSVAAHVECLPAQHEEGTDEVQHP